jgi:hypothetical protein
MSNQRFIYHDGGRAAAGYAGQTGDCVVRAICIATGLPYQDVYSHAAVHNATTRKTKRRKHAGKQSVRSGVYTRTKKFKDYMRSLGFVWTPTMSIGSGCKVHLAASDLPNGKLIASVSKHWCAVIDGVIYDTHDPSRRGTRCVYGYWMLATAEEGE